MTIRNFEIIDESTETESSSGNTIPVLRAARTDLTLEDGSIKAAERAALTGTPSTQNVSGI